MFNNNLKEAREELEMDQEEFGNLFNVSRKTVSGWETGADTMPFERLAKLCNKYGYSLDFIVGFTRKNIKYKNNINLDKIFISNRLKKFRNKINLSQRKFSKECGFAQTTYSEFETGKHLINTITLYTICKTYNISMDYLVGRTNNPKIK